ncbi:MAG: hypothetical protein ACLFVU_01860 [Phycisphaerae bacterium]
MGRTRLIQTIALLTTILCLVAAGLVQEELNDQTEEYELVAPENAAEGHPEAALLMMAPGGLRAPLVSWLWIRTNELNEEGHHYDAMQMAELICALQPRFAGVWNFMSWNMAWNISVTTHTPHERWLWVHNGMILLRDRAIPLNRDALSLYYNLGWTFFNKMGGNLDDMHMFYKRRWAGTMQRVIASPPLSGDEVTINAVRVRRTEKRIVDARGNTITLPPRELITDELLVRPDDEIIERIGRSVHFLDRKQRAMLAIAKINRAPLGKNLAAQGKVLIQRNQLEKLTQPETTNPELAAQIRDLIARLADLDVEIGWDLLDAYNTWSEEYPAETVRISPPSPEGERQEALYALINAEKTRPALHRLLDFVRAQLLWNEYKMDPAYMLELMFRYDAPLDWRQVWSHSLYWSALGNDRAGKGRTDVVALNNSRVVLNSLKDLFRRGRMTLREEPADPEWPEINMLPDPAYIEAVHQQHLEYAIAAVAIERNNPDSFWADFDRNMFRSGHVNFLVEAIQVLVVHNRMDEARRYLDFIREEYNLTEGRWAIRTIEDFVIDSINREGRPIPNVARNLIYSSLAYAFWRRSQGDAEGYDDRYQFALKVYNAYMEKAHERISLAPWDVEAGRVLTGILVDPGVYGYNISLIDRSRLYRVSPPELQRWAYLRGGRALARLSEMHRPKLDFRKAFPKPPGFDAFLEEMRRRMQPVSNGG